jgi:hypothetical protein
MCHARRHIQAPARRPVATHDPELRASDAEREDVIARLREHATAGRLDVDELEQRISAVYAARTHGELAVLERDLPRLALPRPVARAGAAGADDAWVAFALVNALLVAIWAFTGAGYFWPGWVIASWGLALVLEGAPRRLRLR